MTRKDHAESYTAGLLIYPLEFSILVMKTVGIAGAKSRSNTVFRVVLILVNDPLCLSVCLRQAKSIVGVFFSR